ncbi:MAG TPA: cache domain-containing protein, partial [Acidobacteriota bacterium]|nr:cache domain-containing protein [Acidobacteriota bacterium]
MTNFKKIRQPFVRHRSVLLGAILIGLVWTTLCFFLNNEHDSAERAAIQNSTNLAGALEEHLSRSLLEIDRSLKVIRTLYVREPGKFDLANWLKSTQNLNDDILQVSIADRDGNVRFRSAESVQRAAINIQEADYFRAQVHAKSDKLAISKPTFEQSSGQWSIQLSRRLENSDGSFNGIIVASLDPAYLTRIYNSVNIGDKGYIRVIGADGIVRATSGRSLSILGKDFSSSDLFRALSSTPAGWYYTNSNLSDKIPRLIAYRSVNDYPLIITVGIPAPVIFSQLNAQKQSAYAIATVLTVLILVVTGFSVRGRNLRDGAQKRLEQANMLLNATLANMPHGICMFGPDKRLV